MLSQRSRFAPIVVTLALVVSVQLSSRAQQPEPLRLSAPPAHSLPAAPLAQGQVQTQTAQGELLDVDVKAGSLTIMTQSGEMTFRYTDQTKVTGSQKGVAGLAAMTGSQVTVLYRKDGPMNLATSIDVRPAK